jgi:hypothetical protein
VNQEISLFLFISWEFFFWRNDVIFGLAEWPTEDFWDLLE